MEENYLPWHRSLPSNPGGAVGDNKIPLFTPYKIKSLTLKNRIVVSPMCTYSSTDGYATDWHLTHLSQFAFGGAGLIFTEATGVTPEGRITPYDTGIWKDEHITQWKRVVKTLHAHGAAVGMQIAHAGRKASTVPPFFPDPRKSVSKAEGGWDVVGPTEKPFSEKGGLIPHQLTKDEIRDIVNHFAEAAKRVDKAGFDVVEIHGAHGYLISSFNSPLSNKRTDEYGGDFTGRTRFCLEVAKAVRAVWPQDKPLFVRLSCSDWIEGGWTVDDTVELSKKLADIGVDVIDCSSGGVVPTNGLKLFSSYQVPFAEAVKNRTPLSSMAVGRIVDPKEANSIVAENRADLVAIGREALRNPRWPIYAAQELGVPAHVVRQYSWIYKL